MIFPIVFGLSILSIFLFFIITKKNKVLSDYYLIAIILFFSGILGSHILMENSPSLEIYLIVLFFNTYYFPVLVSYGLILLDGNKFNTRWLWIYLYPIVYNVLILVDIFANSDYSSFSEIENLFKNPSKFQFFLYLTQYIYVIVLLIWLWKKLNRYTVQIKNYHSTIEHINLNWFRYFILSFLGLSSFGFIVFTCFGVGIIEDIKIPFGIEYVIFVLLLFYLSYNGIKQYSIAEINSRTGQNFKTSLHPSEKYQSSNLDKESIDSYFNEIIQLFIEEKMFLESQLKIEDVAKRMNITVHKVSQIINSKSNKSFFDFVNGYRVMYFKKILSDPDKRKFTILSLGIESGFNSKASMNRVFKNFVGQSPKEYQKSKLGITL
ncbi:helix-turn-helix domain-containing protein [Maribacter sp. HTCC2170]|uniref:helix-turn-helix domain-containing protein n=1 Tax=Maribacter sp. (strain HTCC2170 / KCCM 42371) TaxID=313603 RepID=UPI00006AE65A|nr:AraC family transcriptional regulator [Maribacter sp. HTCC2170]EAR00560.1 transcriptional regulator [Maribacter sp. HTCC2170]